MENELLIVCRCEEVSYEFLLETASKFNCTSRELKLRTRAGMGYCGGRTCRTMIDKITNAQINDHHRTYITLKYQPPIRPVSFRDLGGEQ